MAKLDVNEIKIRMEKAIDSFKKDLSVFIYLLPKWFYYNKNLLIE